MLGPGRAKVSNISPCPQVSLCKVVYVTKPHSWIILKERNLNGKKKFLSRPHMKDMGKSSYRRFISVLFGQLGPILR